MGVAVIPYYSSINNSLMHLLRRKNIKVVSCLLDKMGYMNCMKD